MISKNIRNITQEDLQFLIVNGIPEGKTLEYKQSLQIDLDSDIKEFLASVSSFANTGGGDLIIGISKKEANPVMLLGIDMNQEELFKLRCIVKEEIKPCLSSVVILPIQLVNSKIALVVRVAKSWLTPHRVVFGGDDKYYSRKNNLKYSLDVSDLRASQFGELLKIIFIFLFIIVGCLVVGFEIKRFTVHQDIKEIPAAQTIYLKYYNEAVSFYEKKEYQEALKNAQWSLGMEILASQQNEKLASIIEDSRKRITKIEDETRRRQQTQRFEREEAQAKYLEEERRRKYPSSIE